MTLVVAWTVANAGSLMVPAVLSVLEYRLQNTQLMAAEQLPVAGAMKCRTTDTRLWLRTGSGI